MQIRRTMFAFFLLAGVVAGCQKKITPLPQTVISGAYVAPSIVITTSASVLPVLSFAPAVQINPKTKTSTLTFDQSK